jgi:hypothetical protein
LLDAGFRPVEELGGGRVEEEETVRPPRREAAALGGVGRALTRAAWTTALTAGALLPRVVGPPAAPPRGRVTFFGRPLPKLLDERVGTFALGPTVEVEDDDPDVDVEPRLGAVLEGARGPVRIPRTGRLVPIAAILRGWLLLLSFLDSSSSSSSASSSS